MNKFEFSFLIEVVIEVCFLGLDFVVLDLLVGKVIEIMCCNFKVVDVCNEWGNMSLMICFVYDLVKVGVLGIIKI